VHRDRKRVQDVIERMELEYDKALLALHPLGISVSAALHNQMIGSKVKIHSVWLLHVAWMVWGLGIIATLLSFRTSVLANERALAGCRDRYGVSLGINRFLISSQSWHRNAYPLITRQLSKAHFVQPIFYLMPSTKV
jgi:hypothetical protein